MSEQKYLTPEGLEKIKKELDQLKNIKRKEITKRIEEAVKLGDLSENAEYHEAKDDQGMNEARIRELEEIVKNAVIIKEEDVAKDTVSIGKKVKAKLDGEIKEFTIVGPSESDPIQGLISNESPLGEALVNKKIGDLVEVDTPAGKVKYEILEIE